MSQHRIAGLQSDVDISVARCDGIEVVPVNDLVAPIGRERVVPCCVNEPLRSHRKIGNGVAGVLEHGVVALLLESEIVGFADDDVARAVQ